MSDNKMSEIIRTSVESIRTMLDANTVIGEAITTANGTVIVPVSKVSIGFASGGIDYVGKNASESNQNKQLPNNFGGGGGTGATVSPVAFLVISPDGKVDMLSINEAAPTDPVSQIIGLLERSPQLIEKFKDLFSKKDKDTEK